MKGGGVREKVQKRPSERARGESERVCAQSSLDCTAFGARCVCVCVCVCGEREREKKKVCVCVECQGQVCVHIHTLKHSNRKTINLTYIASTDKSPDLVSVTSHTQSEYRHNTDNRRHRQSYRGSV